MNPFLERVSAQRQLEQMAREQERLVGLLRSDDDRRRAEARKAANATYAARKKMTNLERDIERARRELTARGIPF